MSDINDPKNALRAYVALARGPGAMKRVAEGTFDEPLPEDVELEPDAISTELPAIDPTDMLSGPGGGVHELSGDETSSLAPSQMFVRVLEELSAYVAPDAARRALAQSLAQSGVHPDEATSLDLREAVVDVLPTMLGAMVSAGDLELVLERLERALTEAIVPTRASTTGTTTD